MPVRVGQEVQEVLSLEDRMMKRLEDMTEPELAELLTLSAKAIEKEWRLYGVQKPHFCLVVFNDPALGQYISNCQRDSMIKAMRETADRLERRQDVPR